MTSHIKVPQGGQKIVPGQAVPDNPIIPFIEGDGIGIDITPVMMKVIDAAVEKAYGGKKKIHWMEVYAGEKSTRLYGPDEWLPKETFDALKEYSVSIKGPMTTPVGGGIRSLNVALRQELDLYQCVRPVQYFKGVPSPLKNPELTNMVIFRENTEDIYAGIEWAAQSEGARKIIDFLQKEMGVKKIRFPETSGIGIKPISIEGTTRIVRAAMKYAIENDRKSVTLVHKGNIMKFTEGLFRDTGYKVAREEFGAELIDGGPWCKFKNPRTGREIVVKNLGNHVRDVHGIAGATVMGDGSVVLIINPGDLLSSARTVSPVRTLKTSSAIETVRRTRTVLVVDDSPSVRRIVTTLLRSNGWEPIPAKDGVDALEILNQGARPDAILLDVEMPRMDGYEFLSTIRAHEQWERLPVVMVTSRAGDKHRRKALDLGASAYLVKPYQDEFLLRTLRDLISQAESA